MPTLRYTGGGRFRHGGRTFEHGDTATVDSDTAAHLLETAPFEELIDVDGRVVDETPATPPFDPGEHSVADLRDRLDDATLTSDELEALTAAESQGKKRTTALDAIETARGD